MSAETKDGNFGDRDWIIGCQSDEIRDLKFKIERLTEQLKTAVWSDSEHCKLVEADNERLRAALTRIAAIPYPLLGEPLEPGGILSFQRLAYDALGVNEQTTPKYGCGHPQIADQDGTLPECPFCAAQNR